MQNSYSCYIVAIIIYLSLSLRQFSDMLTTLKRYSLMLIYVPAFYAYTYICKLRFFKEPVGRTDNTYVKYIPCGRGTFATARVKRKKTKEKRKKKVGQREGKARGGSHSSITVSFPARRPR